MIIPHPLLGPRDASEFTYLGDASLISRPDSEAADAPDPASNDAEPEPDAIRRFHDYLHLRDNPAGVHRELWYHEHGDRSWLVVTRDTCTHEILGAELATDVARKQGRGR